MNSSLSALELRVQAWQRLANGSDTNGDGEVELSEENRTQLREALNESFKYYQGLNRTNSSALFEADKEVAEETGRRRPNVTARLIESDGQLARTAIQDAERLKATLTARGVSLDEALIEEHLGKAEKAMDQAAHVREKSPNPVAAITHYKRAWEHAQHVLDIMDAAVPPEVSIVRRADPRHNGSYNYTLVGEVFAVRPAALDNATVTINGASQTIPIHVRNVTPGSSAMFVARVTLDEKVNNITVTIADSGETRSEYSEDFEPNAGSAGLKLDADGLSDVYERTNTTTDPLDTDSDASATAINEAENGTVDGLEDYDNDGLTTIAERSLGTDPLASDTDADNVSDFFEVLLTKTDPLVADTDGDGTLDGMEDLDDDGLTNAREEAARTHPNVTDTDGDTLDDPVEVHGKTNPLLADSDMDGLDDAVEPTDPFQTDPVDPDTDDDGILDGNETYRDAVTNESVNTTVQVIGKGDVGGQTQVMDEQRAGFDNDLLGTARASSVVEVRSTAELEVAMVRIHYDESEVENESSLRVYRFNETGQYFEQLRSKVYPEKNLAVAQTREVGLFVVMSPAKHAAMFRAPGEINQSTVNKTTFETPGSKCTGVCSSDGDSLAVGVTEDGPVGSSDNSGALGVQSVNESDGNESSRILWQSNRTYTVVSDGNTTEVYNRSASPSNNNSTKDTNASVVASFNASNTESESGNTSAFSTASAQPASSSSWITLQTMNMPQATKIIFKSIVQANVKQNSSVKARLKASSTDSLYSLSCSSGCPKNDQRLVRDDVTHMAGETAKLQVKIIGTGSITLGTPTLIYEKDTDGDGIADEIDLCKNTKGSKKNEGCPYESTVPVISFNVSDEIANMTIEASGETDVANNGSSASFFVDVWYQNNTKDTKALVADTSVGKETYTNRTVRFRNLSNVENVTLRLRTTGLAMIKTTDVDVRIDADGDGLWNAKELQGFNTTRWGTVWTNYTDADTDDDNLSDAIEVGEAISFFTENEDGERVARTTYKAIAHPEWEHSDSDSLNDSMEYYGWDVSVVNRSGSLYRWNATGEKASGETFGEVHFSSRPWDGDTDDDGLFDDTERNETHTNPNATVTYGITTTHETEIFEALYEEWEDADSSFEQSAIESKAQASRLADSSDLSGLDDVELTDATDDFDFVRPDDGSLVFTGLNGHFQTDVWYSNHGETLLDTDPWDPDTDDDGLTDGQETWWISMKPKESDTYLGFVKVTVYETSPTSPDSDGDGWWDGWIGVYDVGRTDNVVLYREHLRDEDMGIQAYEMVQAQVGVHDSSEAPLARGADIDSDPAKEHSNIHLGELYWGTNPDIRSNDPAARTQLSAEVDWIEGENPFTISKNGVSLLESTERNLALYGFDVEYTKGERILKSELRSTCKAKRLVTIEGNTVYLRCHALVGEKVTITPDELNRWELDIIEDKYHDDPSKLHVLWGTTMGNDIPATPVDKQLDYSGVAPTGIAFINGAPGTELFEQLTDLDFGYVILNQELHGFGGRQATTMHELGHVLGVGYADDTPIPINASNWSHEVVEEIDVIEHGFEVYSGDVVNPQFEPDSTPEIVLANGDPEWSIMSHRQRSFSNQGTPLPRYVYSIEELSTIDFDHIPSKEDD